MDTDLYLAIGIVLLVLTIPAVVSALSDGRAPRLASLVLMVGGVMVAVAVSNKSGGYTFGELPSVLIAVLARYVG